MADIWAACQGEQHIRRITGKLYRLVESQEQIATLGYVDTLDEQAVLEELLESVKPGYPQAGFESRRQYHYLLKTPFRYPPLPWGSRFGRRHEPGIFYGGCSIGAALAESAYYRFVFWRSIDNTPTKSSIRSEHSLFSASYATDYGIQLQNHPFDQHYKQLTDPQNYQHTQLLGSAMRDAGVHAFEYRSARDPQQGHCAGLFTPTAFRHTRPADLHQYLCELRADEVVFKPQRSTQLHRYKLEHFMVKEEFPLPPP